MTGIFHLRPLSLAPCVCTCFKALPRANMSQLKLHQELCQLKEELDNSVWELRLCNFLMSNANVSYSTKSVVECFYLLSRGIAKAQKVDVYYSSFKPILHIK